MDPENITVEALQILMAQKDEIEAELHATRSWLVAPGNLGLSGGILDDEGFPINDVDKIIATRDARGLQNDHIDIMKRIETGIYELHKRAREDGTASHEGKPASSGKLAAEPETPVTSSSVTLEEKYANLKPFAKVNTVSQLSPAFKAELKADDQILRMGDVTVETGGFEKLKDLVSASEGKELLVVVRRTADDGDTKVMELTLKPNKWTGPGLLGCHLLPLTVSHHS